MLIKAEARVDRVGIAELASVEGASGTISQGGMVAVAGGQWDEHGGSSMPFGWAGELRCLLASAGNDEDEMSRNGHFSVIRFTSLS